MCAAGTFCVFLRFSVVNSYDKTSRTLRLRVRLRRLLPIWPAPNCMSYMPWVAAVRLARRLARSSASACIRSIKSERVLRRMGVVVRALVAAVRIEAAAVDGLGDGF